MNYADFYISAERMLVDSLVSLWFKGRAKEQNYMRKIMTEDEPLLAEPVFQSIFPWEEGRDTFGEHANKLGILTPQFVEALSNEKVSEDLRFPKDRHPYKHQTRSWQTMLSGKGKTIVVTSGTGSGKTECFMIPVLQDIAQRNEKGCIQAIFLYPLNALMKSQQKRIHAWCDAIQGKVTYAIYNGDTEKSKRAQNYTEQFYPQLITRPQIRQTPPQVLFTNPTMLNYMLVRAEDKEILEKSKGKLKWILLDEAHTYTGSAASELALQLRRVLDAFGVTIDQVNFAVTSATMGDEKNPATEIKLKKFVAQLTGKPLDSIVVIGGKRVIPEMDRAKAQDAIYAVNREFNTNITFEAIERLRVKLNSKPVLTTNEIAKLLDSKISKSRIESLRLIEVLGNKIPGLNLADGKEASLLPSRAHFFIRSINGVYVCVNPDCDRHKVHRLNIGNLTTYQNTNCPSCKSKMLEVTTCPSCGGLIVFGESSNAKGFRMHTNVIDLEKTLFYDESDDISVLENQAAEITNNDEDTDGFTPFYFAKPEGKCLRHHTMEYLHLFDHKESKIKIAPEDTDWETAYKSLRHSDRNQQLCPHCGNAIKDRNYLRASATQMGRILSSLLLDNAEVSKGKDTETLYDGRKYITFTDNRQGSARSAMGINQDVERAWIRSSIFHKLADKRLDLVPPAGLSDSESQLYSYLTSQPRELLPQMLQEQLRLLEAKKNGNSSIPAPPEMEWDELIRTLENDVEFRTLYKHLKETRGNSKYPNQSSYLKALLVDQFGWIPRRANSLENMGFVRLVYPDLKKAKCPNILASKGCSNQDWQDFLKICIDYQIRGGRHYMLSDEFNSYLTQINFTSAIYPSNSDLRRNGFPVTKWPKLKHSQSGVSDSQSRLVLLLCAFLGYDNESEFNQEKSANIDSILKEAWDFLTTNILTPVDSENNGYMLDLLGSKVRLQQVATGHVCPVDNVIVDVVFKGYSPRMNGYIGKENFKRFLVTQTFDYPYFPYRTTEGSDKSVKEWIKSNLSKFLETGLYSDIHERIYLKRPIFLAAEHSAQQSNEDLDRFEKDFNAGRLNILSCSTTMEMGVDIGGISEVVMNNVPPKSSNYLQRAGRAGRRNESKALALTFCAPNPIGSHTWSHPHYPITHLTETPLLKLESRQLIQRHINAFIFGYFVAEQGGFKVTSRVKDFFIKDDGISLFDAFLIHIDKIISGQHRDMIESYMRIVRGTVIENVSLDDAAYSTKRDIALTKDGFDAHWVSLEKTLEYLRNSGSSGNAIKAIEIQRDNFLKASLLPYLAETSFLPSAGIPTGLVQCILGVDNGSEYPTMHLSQAISSYAPGSKIIKNEWVYEPTGIRLKSKYDNSTSRYILQNCTNCGYTTINYGSAMTGCHKCGKSNSMYGIRDISASTEQRFTEVVEPAAFSVAYGSKPTRKMDNSPMNFVQPVLLEMEPWHKRTSSAKLTVRCSTPKSEILFYNRGRHGYGYAFCPYCGRMQSEKAMDSADTVMVGHKHLSSGSTCPGGESNGSSIRRHVLLVGRYQTDFVEIKIYDKLDNQVVDTETLYSLGVILSRKLTELLGVNDGEIEFGYDNINHSIFIYDTALGGAGYSTLFREYKDTVLDMAYKALKSCDCERACTKCLIDRRSQWYLNYLNRQKVVDWLETERLSRTAPDEIIDVVADAYGVTADLATEFSQLCRNQNLKAIKLFVNSDYSSWFPSDYPYTRLVDELKMSGVDVAFVLSKDIKLSEISSAERAMVFSTLFKYNIKCSNTALPSNIEPLIEVELNDGSKKLYFGKDINTTFSADWGNGNLYQAPSPVQFSYSQIQSDCLLTQLSERDDTIMFDTRIKKDCGISEVFDTLVSYKDDNWNSIKNRMKCRTISIEYSDRYLYTPLGCVLFAQMVTAIKDFLEVEITGIMLNLTRPYGNSLTAYDEVGICEDFSCSSDRNNFLSEAIESLVGITPVISDSGYIQHERSLAIKAFEVELYIRPDAGISNGWKPFGRNNSGLKVEDFRENWRMPMSLYNQKKNGEGILYTISFGLNNDNSTNI